MRLMIVRGIDPVSFLFRNEHIKDIIKNLLPKSAFFKSQVQVFFWIIFCSPWNPQKTIDFPMISGGIKVN